MTITIDPNFKVEPENVEAEEIKAVISKVVYAKSKAKSGRILAGVDVATDKDYTAVVGVRDGIVVQKVVIDDGSEKVNAPHKKAAKTPKP